jgi:hypothetical protein
LLTSVIASRTRTDEDDDDDDGGNAIDAGRGARAIGNAATTTTRRRCVLCARENSANERRNGRRNDVRCGGGVSGDATMASTSQGKGGDGAEPEQARRGRCDDDVAVKVERERGSIYARAHTDDRRRGGRKKGCDDGMATN